MAGMHCKIKYQKSMVVLIATLLVGCSARHAPAPVSTIYTGNTTSNQKIHPSATFHTVKRGETLYSIAFRADQDFRKLAEINGISAPYTIFTGQKIRLKGSAKKSVKKAVKPDQKLTKKADIPKIAKTVNQKSTKAVAREKSKEYGDSQARQKTYSAQAVKKQSYSNKVSWRWPTKGKLSRRFSTKENGYKGLQITNRVGTPITAAADGVVVYAGDALRGYGNLIIVKHNDDYLSAYAHNKRIVVTEKQTVKAGQKIAEMGSTDASVVGLRFEVRYRGKSVNPLKYLPK